MTQDLRGMSDEALRRDGWKWKVRLTYNDTVKPPKVPGAIAIEVVLKDDSSKDFEVEASRNRTDVNIDVYEL